MQFMRGGGRPAHVPQERLAEAPALAGGPGELEGGVHDVRVQAQLVRHALCEVRVAAAEHADGQDAKLVLPVVTPAIDCTGAVSDLLCHRVQTLGQTCAKPSGPFNSAKTMPSVSGT